MGKYDDKTKFNSRSASSMGKALDQSGVDIQKYLSLLIKKGSIPKDAELRVQYVDKATGKVVPVNLNDDMNALFGKKSRFYGKVMADGHIFNPYIHRRFIAAQFREFMSVRSLHSSVQSVYSRAQGNSRFEWGYAMKQLLSECSKLALLEKKDPIAFNERSRFFTLDAVQNVIDDYVTLVHKSIDEYQKRSSAYRGAYYISGFGYVDAKHIRPLKYRFECLRNDVQACRSYEELNKLFSKFEFPEDLISYVRPVPVSFMRPFLNAGAYYTMKHAFMFEGKCLAGMDQQRSLERLDQTADSNIPDSCLKLYIDAGF